MEKICCLALILLVFVTRVNTQATIGFLAPHVTFTKLSSSDTASMRSPTYRFNGIFQNIFEIHILFLTSLIIYVLIIGW